MLKQYRRPHWVSPVQILCILTFLMSAGYLQFETEETEIHKTLTENIL